MNPSNAKGSMYVTSSTSCRKVGDPVPDQFPAGLRVMVVDDDPTCLMILEKMLRTCLYQVTKCNRAEIALSLLRKNRDGYDVVISDVHMPDMDGFQLLVDIGLEMDLPVIMMSADDSQDVVMKGVTHGACDYLIKPVRIEALKNIWQHVIRRKRNEWKDFEQSGNGEEGERQQKLSEEADYSSSANEGNWTNSKRRKEDEDETDDREDTSTLKKPRVVWSVELHQQFVAAVNQLGIDKAVPKKILELMNVPGLTRENVASHLQKYRLYLRRLSGVTQQSNLGSSFVNPQEAAFGPLSSLHGLDFQTLAATGQFQAQSLATLQAAGMGRPVAKSGVPMSLIDQRDIFSFDNPKLRYGESQQRHMSSIKHMNLLHGIPTTMEPKQLSHMHHPSAQPVRHMNIQVSREQGGQNNALLMQMAQPQSRPFNETATIVSSVPSSLGQTLLPNGIAANVSTRSGIPENVRGTGYNQAQQNSSMPNYSINCTPEPPRNSLPLGSTSVIPPLTTKGACHEEVRYDVKGSSGGLIPSYDVFEELQQHKPSNWDLHNVGLSFDGSQHSNSVQSNVGLASSLLGHVAFPSNQMSGENRSVFSGGKVMFSAGYNSQNGNTRTVSHHLNTINIDNSMRVKDEAVSDVHSNLFGEQFGQEDLMSALLKQQSSGGAAQNEFDLDGYSMDNIPV